MDAAKLHYRWQCVPVHVTQRQRCTRHFPAPATCTPCTSVETLQAAGTVIQQHPAMHCSVRTGMHVRDARLLTCRTVQLEAEAHKKTAHPYAPFPVERLEAAVTAVPLEAFPTLERELASFGPAYRFWCAQGLHVLSSSCTPPWLVPACSIPRTPAASNQASQAKSWGAHDTVTSSGRSWCRVLCRRDGSDGDGRGSSNSSNGAGDSNAAAFTPPDAPVDSMADLSRLLVAPLCCLWLI